DTAASTLFLLALAPDFLSRTGGDALWKLLVERKHLPLTISAATRERIERGFRRILNEQAASRPGAELAIQAEAMRILVALGRLPDAPEVAGAAARAGEVLELLRE